jgi:hypothetical protein
MAQTKSITVYNQDLLNKYLEKDEAILVGTYEKLTRDIDIKFKCKCRKDGKKMFRYIVENAGMRCSACSIKTKTEKLKATCLQNYGVDNHMKVHEIKLKNREQRVTFTLDRLTQVVGDNLIGEYDKRTLNRETVIMYHCICCNDIYEKTFRMIEEGGGLVCKLCCDAGKYEKIRQSLKSQYGVEYSLQVPVLNDKATFKGLKYKEYIGPSGKIYNCQGYEPFALDLLFIDYSDEDIINDKKKVPEVWWVDGDGKEHRYYVDIYIPKEKRMIEVKSDYRYEKDKDKLEFVWRTCVEQGYDYEIWIFDKHQEIVEFKTYSSSSLKGSTSTSSKLSSSSSDR